MKMAVNVGVYKSPCASVLYSFICRRKAVLKMPRLSAADRNIAIGRVQAGESFGTVARHLNVHKTTISRLWSRYNNFNLTNDRPRSGRPRITTPLQDRYIRVHHLRNRHALPTVTATQIPGLRRVSAQTIRNRLKEAGLRACRPVVGPVLRPLHRRRRLRWCNNVRIRTLQNWRRIWFSDESRFLLQRHDGRQRLYRRRHKRFAPICVRQVDRFGGESVMVWGTISYNQKSDLVIVPGNLTAQRYINHVLELHLLPIIDQQTQIFQRDNARPHTARATMNFLQNSNVNVLP